MGKWLRDIWSEVIVAGVLAVMASMIGFLQNADPLIIAIISFAVILITFRIIYYFQEKKLKIRLGIERERWNKLREERIRLRKPYENRLEISSLLSQMHDQAILFTKRQLQENITKTKWEKIFKDVRRVIPKLTIISMFFLPRLQWLGKSKRVQRMMMSFVLDITGILRTHGYGSLQAESEEIYSGLYNSVKIYEDGLPPKICKEIEGNIMLSKMLSTLQIFDPSQPFIRKLNINPSFVNKFQFLLPTAHMMLSQSRGNIHEAIERWLTGE